MFCTDECFLANCFGNPLFDVVVRILLNRSQTFECSVFNRCCNIVVSPMFNINFTFENNNILFMIQLFSRFSFGLNIF